jgi:hypothetical protein
LVDGKMSKRIHIYVKGITQASIDYFKEKGISPSLLVEGMFTYCTPRMLLEEEIKKKERELIELKNKLADMDRELETTWNNFSGKDKEFIQKLYIYDEGLYNIYLYRKAKEGWKFSFFTFIELIERYGNNGN